MEEVKFEIEAEVKSKEREKYGLKDKKQEFLRKKPEYHEIPTLEEAIQHMDRRLFIVA